MVTTVRRSSSRWSAAASSSAPAKTRQAAKAGRIRPSSRSTSTANPVSPKATSQPPARRSAGGWSGQGQDGGASPGPFPPGHEERREAGEVAAAQEAGPQRRAQVHREVARGLAGQQEQRQGRGEAQERQGEKCPAVVGRGGVGGRQF